MRIYIDENSTMPNYQQIILQIKKNIIMYQLKEHDQLPSIRTLSKDLNVAIVTVKRAYEELENQGITYTLTGKGVYVASVDITKLKEELALNFMKDFLNSIDLCRYFGFSNQEIESIFRKAMNHE